MQRIMGWQGRKVTTFEEMKALIDNGFSVIRGDFMDFGYSFPDKNVMHWSMRKCWAYEGMKKLGVEKEYQCGVLWRVECWIKNAGVKFEMDPPVKTCLLNSRGKCEGEFRFFFE